MSSPQQKNICNHEIESCKTNHYFDFESTPFPRFIRRPNNASPQESMQLTCSNLDLLLLCIAVNFVISVFFFFFSQFFKKLDYVPRSGLYDAVNCTVHASDLRKYDKRINKLNEYAVVDVARDKLAQVSGVSRLLSWSIWIVPSRISFWVSESGETTWC